MPDWMSEYHRVSAAYEEEFRRNRQLHGTRIRCERGCSECCHQLFQITELEAVEISRGVRSLPPEQAEVLRARADAYLSARKVLTGAPDEPEAWGSLPPPGSRLACPALDEGACAIYPHRPLICRKFGIPLWNPDRPGRVYACALNFREGDEIADGQLIQIQTALHVDWKGVQAAYSRAGQWRDPDALTVARAIVEDFSERVS